MNRPAPRKSGLVGTSPLTPPAPAAAVVPQPAVSTVVVEPVVTSGVEPAAPVQTSEKYPRLNYYVKDADTAGRIRAAYLAGRSQYDWASFSEMQAAAVLALVSQLEQEINGGAQFSPKPAGAVPTGRSVK